MAQSAVEAKFIVETVVNQALWLRKILRDLNLKQKENTKIFVDNEVVTTISHNPIFYGKTKHFNIKLFFLRKVQRNDVVTIVYCKTEEQIANIFTKSLSTINFDILRMKLGACSS